jgi:hypothetical protein
LQVLSPLRGVFTRNYGLNLLADGVAGASGGKATAVLLQYGGVLDPAVTNFLNSQSYNSSRPKAFSAVVGVLHQQQFSPCQPSRPGQSYNQYYCGIGQWSSRCQWW